MKKENIKVGDLLRARFISEPRATARGWFW